MKKYLLAISVCLSMAACQPSGGDAANSGLRNEAAMPDTGLYPVLSLLDKDTLHDFGTIPEGTIVEYNFKFKNTGNKDLIITYASSTCGCTVPEYPKQPVKPGEESFIKVRFNSENKTGHQEKPVFIMANSRPPQTNLKITCDVIKADQQ